MDERVKEQILAIRDTGLTNNVRYKHGAAAGLRTGLLRTGFIP